jgi:hypothetical protein
MKDKEFLDKINPERREFLEKVTKGAFIIPAVISVMMLNQKLNLNTANAQSNDAATVCLSHDTSVSTPEGNVPIADLMTGMSVFTLDSDGNKVIKPVVLLSKAFVPETYELCHLILSDERELFISDGHPTADGKEIRDFCQDDIFDGTKIVSIETVKYAGGYVYDLLPEGETGLYWANGVLIGSTLSPNSRYYIGKIFQPEEQPIDG